MSALSVPSALVASTATAQSGLEFSNDVRRAVARGTNKHLQVVETRLRSLNLEMVQTKNNIIKNVLKSRSIEKTQNRVAATQELLRQQVLAFNHPEVPLRMQERQIALAKDFRVQLESTKLKELLFLAGDLSAEGLGLILKDALLAFKPKDLLRILQSCPAEKSGQIEKELFIQIARACSNGCISDHEAACIFDHTAARTGSTRLWINLKRRLLRKLLTLYAAAQGMRYLREQDAEKLKHFKFPAALLSRSMNNLAPAAGLDEPSDHLASTSVSVMSSTSKKLSKPAPDSKSRGKPSRLEALSQELDRSQQQQRKLQEQIAINLADFYANKGSDLSTKTGPASGSMSQYFKSLAAKKLFAVLLPRAKRLQATRFHTWRQVLRVLLVERDCEAVAKGLAVVRLVRLLRWSDVGRTSDWFERWRHTIAFLNHTEAEAAAIEIQRSFRGYLTRISFKKMMTLRAAAAIQNTFRVHIAKKFARKALRRRLVRRAVHKIEVMWQAFRWRRAIKKGFLFQRQTRAARNIQRVWRGHRGRRAYHLRLLKRLQIVAATKFQALFRRYRAILFVEARRLTQRRLAAVLVIQKHVRGRQARKRWAVRWRRHLKAKVIQYGWWCSQAIKETWRRRRRRCAIQIQRVARGRQARQRVWRLREEKRAREEAERLRRAQAIEVIAPLGLGHITRRRIAVPMQAHLHRRQQAARALQRHLTAIRLGLLARRRVKKIRADLADSLRRNFAARQVQRIGRGVLARRRVAGMLAVIAQEQDARQRWPLYYRLKQSYIQSQDLYHRKKVIKIQALARRFLAKKKVKVRRVDRSARTIQSFMSSRKMIMEAKSVRMELASRKYAQKSLVPRIQKVVRGYVVRIRLRKAAALRVLRWVMKEVRVRRDIARAVDTFRVRKAIEKERRAAATRIQALIRGFVGKRRYRKGFKSLQRQRAIRVRAKRVNAALVVQCAFRCYRARTRVVKQRLLFAEREHERRELDILEKSIEGMHEAFMTELLVIRAQTGVRAMLARQEFVERVRKYRAEQDKSEEVKRVQAAVRLQSRIRGVLGRRRFKKMQPALKQARRMRSLCVECETRPAVRRCRQCKDQFCEDCYDLLHQKGKRKGHTFAAFIPDARALGMAYESRDPKLQAAAGKKGGRGDWEEFFDSAAKAKYWFNKVTGEASWINPHGK